MGGKPRVVRARVHNADQPGQVIGQGAWEAISLPLGHDPPNGGENAAPASSQGPSSAREGQPPNALIQVFGREAADSAAVRLELQAALGRIRVLERQMADRGAALEEYGAQLAKLQAMVSLLLLRLKRVGALQDVLAGLEF